MRWASRSLCRVSEASRAEEGNANLADDIAGLYVTDGLHIVRERVVVVLLVVQRVSRLQVDIRDTGVVELLRLRDAQG